MALAKAESLGLDEPRARSDDGGLRASLNAKRLIAKF